MALIGKFKVVEASFIDYALRAPGEIVEIDLEQMLPGSNLEAFDDVAKEFVASMSPEAIDYGKIIPADYEFDQAAVKTMLMGGDGNPPAVLSQQGLMPPDVNPANSWQKAVDDSATGNAGIV